ncbi:MAG: sulfotransferase [Candidatus Solibacter sp.]
MSGTDSGFITIVSGLPRSGTSMMMKMLESGGIPPVTDDFRKADDDNPNGYFEYEPVKRLRQESSWVETACNKALKVIYVFLYDLPPGQRYKVIFMRRNLEDVVASQKAMLRHRQEADRMTDDQLMTTFAGQLARLDDWIRRQPDFTIRYVDYDDVVADPYRASAEVAAFLDTTLDVPAMARSVHPELHRNRSAAGTA